MTSNRKNGDTDAIACEYHALACARPVEECPDCVGGGRTYRPIAKTQDGFPLTHTRLWERVAVATHAPNATVIGALSREDRETLEGRLETVNSGNTVIGSDPRERALAGLI